MTSFLCVMTAIFAVTFAGKSKFQLPGSQSLPSANDRALSEDEDLLKCGGKPVIPSNADGVDCWTDDFGIFCVVSCPDGWRPAKKNWTKCHFKNANSKRNFRWLNKLASCIPTCPDLSETLKKLPTDVRVEQEINPNRRGLGMIPYYELEWIKFSCDDQHQLSIKGGFKILFFFLVLHTGSYKRQSRLYSKGYTPLITKASIVKFSF